MSSKSGLNENRMPSKLSRLMPLRYAEEAHKAGLTGVDPNNLRRVFKEGEQENWQVTLRCLQLVVLQFRQVR